MHVEVALSFPATSRHHRLQWEIISVKDYPQLFHRFTFSIVMEKVGAPNGGSNPLQPLCTTVAACRQIDNMPDIPRFYD